MEKPTVILSLQQRIRQCFWLPFGWKALSLNILAGAFMALALAPFHIWFTPFFAFPIFVLSLDTINRQSGTWPKRILRFTITGWCFGFGYFVTGLWWLGNAMLVDPDAFAWAIPFASLGLPAYLALYWGLAAALCALLWKQGASRIFLLAVALGLGEWLRGHLLTGFPWNPVGIMAMPTPIFMQISALFGTYGVTLLAIFTYAAFVFVIESHGRKLLAFVGFILIIFQIAFGFWRLDHAPSIIDNQSNLTQSNLIVRLIQPSIQQSDKMNDETRLDILEKHLALTSLPPKKGDKQPDLIIWPETSVPYILSYVAPVRDKIAAALQPGQLAIMGTVRFNNEDGEHYFNSIEVLDHQGNIIASADKNHLVPFGEYLPYATFFKSLGLAAIADSSGGYQAASQRNSITLPNHVSFLPLICYEAIFPDEMAYHGTHTDFMINVTNDAWFGDTPGPYQHFQQAQIRSIETGQPLIRAANNGISAVIDPYGRIIAMMALNETGFVDAAIPHAIVPIWSASQQNTPFLFLLIAFAIVTLLVYRHKNYP